MDIKILEHFWLSFVVQIPFLICACWVIPKQWKKIKSSFRKKDNKKLWIWSAIFFIVKLIILFGKKPKINTNLTNTFNYSPVLFFILTCLIAPVAEECFFRYLIFENFNKKKNNSIHLFFFWFYINA